MKNLYFISGNKGKLREVQEKFSSLGVQVMQKDMGYPEIQAESLEEVVQYGIENLQNRISEPFIIEDAGIFIDALNGFPGVYSKHVYYTIGLDRVLKLMRGISNRSAVFRSVYGFCDQNGISKIFIGECSGTITYEKKGVGGFGYDPIFIPNGQSKTFAEMEINEKNKLSHRGFALNQFITYLEKYLSNPFNEK